MGGVVGEQTVGGVEVWVEKWAGWVGFLGGWGLGLWAGWVGVVGEQSVGGVKV